MRVLFLARPAAGGMFLCLAGALLSGCSQAVPEPVIAQAVAPVAPSRESKSSIPPVRFVDVTDSSDIGFKHESFAFGEKLLPETMGSGVAVLDYDTDGDFDLFFVNSATWPGQEEGASEAEGKRPTPALYRNEGGWRFQDVTKEAGLDVVIRGMGATVGDYDNDGDADLYVTGLGSGRLFRNEGGRFGDATEEAKAAGRDGWQSSACFLDIENDGDLDLFIAYYVVWTAEIDRGVTTHLAGKDSLAYDPPTAFGGTVNVLLRNDGGEFRDVTSEAGFEVLTADLRSPLAKSLGVAPYDIDGDGLVDIAVANDTVPNFLFHNLGGGRFEEIGTVAGMAYDQGGLARGAMGIDWGDFRRDGSLGLAVANFANEMTALYVCDEPESMQFSDLANLYGLGAPTQPPLKFGLFFFDYDLDGRLDLLSTNGHLESDIALVQASESHAQSAQLFWNTGKPGRTMFQLVSSGEAGEDLFRPIVGRGSAFADLDGDGDLDVVMTANGGRPLVLRNDGGNSNRWLRLKLVGTRSNRDGLGARVVVRAGGVEQRAQHQVARSYLSCSEGMLTFGLGRSESAEEVEIVWPSGSATRLKGVRAGQVLEVEEGAQQGQEEGGGRSGGAE